MKTWRVSVDLIHGVDFMVRFDDRDLAAAEKAANLFVVEAHKSGFVMRPGTTELIPMSAVKRMWAHEYEIIDVPNPAGVDSPVARAYGGGTRTAPARKRTRR